MKVGDKGTPFQRLSAGTVEGNPKAKAEIAKDVSNHGIEKAAQKNTDAAATITRVVQANQRPEPTKGENVDTETRNRKEVEASMRDASDLNVKDVDRFANIVGKRILNNPDQAEQAHKPKADKVHELLQ